MRFPVAADVRKVSIALPDPPETLGAAPRAFYDELRRMLAVVQPTQLDSRRTSVRFDRHGIEIDLVHATRDDATIWATVGDEDAIVATGSAHEHFFAPDPGEEEDRRWTTEIVDFIAEILRGEIEVETTLRGNTPLSVRHFHIDERGERRPLGYTGFLVPARLLVWRPKRTETERISWL